MNDNIFAILGIQACEDAVSNALAYGFNHNPKFRTGFLKRICDRQFENFDHCIAHTRTTLADYASPDMVIACHSKKGVELFVIENRLLPGDNSHRTRRYASREMSRSLHQRLCPDLPDEKLSVSYVCLALFPDEVPKSGQFFVRQHSQLCGLLGDMSGGKGLANKLITDWLSLVETFDSKSRVSLADRICDKLRDDGLNAGYLYFCNFLKQLKLPTGLEIEDFFNSRIQGQRYYGAIFFKGTWHPAKMIQSAGEWVLDPDTMFNIHLEPQFNVSKSEFAIEIHYEVNPYETPGWLKDNIQPGQYTAYLERRGRFCELMAGAGLDNWIFPAGGDLTPSIEKEPGRKDWIFAPSPRPLAAIELNVEDYRTGDLIVQLEEIMKEASQQIDCALGKL
jgi:hypothetical protein